jgi:hypothetical protein
VPPVTLALTNAERNTGCNNKVAGGSGSRVSEPCRQFTLLCEWLQAAALEMRVC